MDDSVYEIRLAFTAISAREANIAASELQKALKAHVGDGIEPRIERANSATMDGGSTIVLLFGTPAILAIAEAIRTWLTKRPSHRDRLEMRTADGTTIIATGRAVSEQSLTAVADIIQKGASTPNIR